MRKNQQTIVLLAACILMVCVLSWMQYYLVKKTYEVKKKEYTDDLKSACNKFLKHPKSISLEAAAFMNLQTTIKAYADGKIAKKDFFKVLNQKDAAITKAAEQHFNHVIATIPLLKDASYVSRTDEIILEKKHKSDTLLAKTDKPYTYFGYTRTQTDLWLLSTHIFESSDSLYSNGPLMTPRQLPFGIFISGTQYVNIKNWKQKLLWQMSGILLLAVTLILAVTVIFYLILRAMIKQKKIAEIQTDFSNNMTHELKTPLSSAGIILKSLARKETRDKPELFDDLLNSLHRQHLKIQYIVDSVLESAVSYQDEPVRSRVNITEKMNDYIRDLQVFPRRVITEISPDNLSLWTNFQMIERVIDNLIENALKYSPENKPVYLKTYLDAGDYCICVIDEGPGIPTGQQKMVFWKFYRISEKNLHHVKGLGLGLYISKSTIEQLGGTLLLKSRPGAGSTFIIKLPTHAD